MTSFIFVIIVTIVTIQVRDTVCSENIVLFHWYLYKYTYVYV